MITRTFVILSLAALLCASSTTVNGFLGSATHQRSKRLEQQQQKLNAELNSFQEQIPLRPGSSVALVTPFDAETGKIDTACLIHLLEQHVAAGTNNLCILGTTGEASVLTMAERKHVLETAVRTVKGKVPILAGTGTINPIATKEMTQQAMDLGCDAALVVSPYYVKPPQRALVKLFLETADIGLPVILYNVPGRTGCNILDETIATCAAHPNIVGVKDATGDLKRLDSLREKLKGVDENFLCYSGDDATSVDFILNGGHGCISVTANVAPKAMHDMVAAALAGDAETARALNEPLTGLHKDLFCEANPIPAKWAVYRAGWINSPYCRPPLDTMDPKFESLVEAAMKKAGVLTAVH